MGWLIVAYWVSIIILAARSLREQKINPPDVSDVEVPSAEPGKEIGVLFGRHIIKSANTVGYWNVKTSPIKKARGGFLFKRFDTVGYKWKADLHQVICRGPIDKILKIYGDDKEAYSETITKEIESQANLNYANIYKPSLYGDTGGVKEGIGGIVYFEFGWPDQEANEYLKSVIDDGEIPAYRNVVSAIYKKFYFGNTSSFRNISYLCQRIHVRQDGEDQWYDQTAEIFDGLDDYIALYFAIDDSGSMENRLEGTVGAIKHVLDFLIGKLQYNLITRVDITLSSFNEGSTVVYSMDSSDVQNLKDYLDALVASGGTNWTAGFSDAETFFSTVPINSERYVFLLTDGAPTVTGKTEQEVTDDTLAILNNILNVNIYCINIEYGYLTYTLQVDNTSEDGVPVLLSDANVISSAILRAISSSSDMNPVHIIRELVTDPDFGMEYSEYDVDDQNFMESADTLFNENFGLSFFFFTEKKVNNFIETVKNHIDGQLFINPNTGLLQLKLIRNDYDESSITEITQDNIQKVENYNESNYDQQINSVTVKYINRETGKEDVVNVDNSAHIKQFGLNGRTIDYIGIRSRHLALRVAQRELLETSTISAVIYTDRSGSTLNIGDPFKFYHSDYHTGYIVMRVTDKQMGDSSSNKIKISCTQDVFSLTSNAMVSPDLSGFVSPNADPDDITRAVITEYPYYELSKSLGVASANSILSSNNDVGYLAVSASRNLGIEINADLTVDYGSGYIDTGTVVDFCASGLIKYDVDNYTDSSITLYSTQDIEDVQTGTHAIVNNEIVRIDSINEDSSGNYVIEVGRGCLDTLPALHDADSIMLFWSEDIYSDDEEKTSSESVNIKLLTNTPIDQLPASSATAYSLTFNSRAIRPYPPGNLKINGSYFPESIGENESLSLTWSHRDRLSQTGSSIIDFEDSDVGPEDGVTYTVRVYSENDDLIKTQSNISGTSFVYSIDDEIADSEIQDLSSSINDSGFSADLSGDFDDYAATLNPFAEWKMYEGSGTTMNDSSGNGYDGTFHNTPTFNQGSMLNSGAGSSIAFNGTNEYCSIKVGDQADFSNFSALTIVIIVQPNNFTNRMKLINKGIDVGGDRSKFTWTLDQDQTTGNIGFGMSNGSDYQINYHSTPLVTTHPQLIICGYDADNLMISINGDIEIDSRTASGQNNETGPLQICRENNNGSGVDYYDGLMCGVRVFNRLLTSTEISNLYAFFSEGPFSDNPLDSIGSGTVFRQNSSLRIELESVRDSYVSYQHYDYVVHRDGFGSF